MVLPAHGYGDYTHAANTWGLACGGAATQPALHWACEPASPIGTVDETLAQWARTAAAPGTLRLVDCAYAPLRLDGTGAGQPDDVWQLWSPNKALGLTGVRAAYVIAPDVGPAAAVRALAPSWPLGADGVALLDAWVQPAVQAWLGRSLATLRDWKARQLQQCAELGWQVLPGSLANFFTAWPCAHDLPSVLHLLRARGIKLRDCASFGLPGHVRLGVLPPSSQQALRQAWVALDASYHSRHEC